MNKQDIADFKKAAVYYATFFTSLKEQGLPTAEAIALTGHFMYAAAAAQAQGKSHDLEALFDRIVIASEKQ